ncbi:MAG: bifunctional 3-deoxy-7-phosphoheptulonate synthase/chorismate mutase [Bacillota bacterium]
MIVKYKSKNKNYYNLKEYLKQKNINFLVRINKNNPGVIIISKQDDSLFNKIENEFNPVTILKEEKAEKYLNKNRYIKLNNEMFFKEEDFNIIAGPCSVENREQMKTLGENLAKMKIKFIRGGAFKPRTSPYQFQGLKEKGLKLLKDIADEYSFKIITEVMDIKNIEIVAQYSDILQVGSRNMYNYSLLKELGEVNKPILLKRGMSASYEEFIMAAEYIYKNGNKNIILCERGIRTFENYTRYTLDLMSVPILKRLSDYPIIIDPSHGTGKWDLIKPAVQAARALKAQGVMVEVHPQPELALSDGPQSLNIDNFKDLVNSLKK